MMPTAAPVAPPAAQRPNFVMQHKITHDNIHTTDNNNKRVDLVLATAQFLPPNHHLQPRFEIMTKSMLVAPRPGGGKNKTLWEGYIRSEIDNTGDNHEPTSDSNYSGYHQSSKVHHPMSPLFVSQITQRAFKHHDKHKTEVVLAMSGITPEGFAAFLQD